MSVVLKVKNGTVLNALYIPDKEKYKPLNGEVLLLDKDVWMIMDIATKRNTVYPSMYRTDTLKKILEKVFRLEPGSINKRRRQEKYAMARFAGMYILHKYKYGSLGEIGKVFGRNHTTVLYGLKMLQNLKDIGSKRWADELQIIEDIYESGELHIPENESISGWIDSRKRVTKNAI